MKNYILFKNPYVLIEDIKGKYQPMYKEYTKHIPCLYLKSPTLCSPFSRARRSSGTKKKPGNQAGLCEICYCKFDNYKSHVSTKKHIESVKLYNNYSQIDAFIAELNKENKINEFLQIQSPCDKLAAQFFTTRNRHSDNNSQTDSSIKMSWISSADVEMNSLKIVLNKIDKKKQDN